MCVWSVKNTVPDVSGCLICSWNSYIHLQAYSNVLYLWYTQTEGESGYTFFDAKKGEVIILPVYKGSLPKDLPDGYEGERQFAQEFIRNVKLDGGTYTVTGEKEIVAVEGVRIILSEKECITEHDGGLFSPCLADAIITFVFLAGQGKSF